MVDSNKAKGERLEQQVATFFAANGYSVTSDGYRGHKSDSMSQTLTAHLHYVLESLGRAYHKNAS